MLSLLWIHIEQAKDQSAEHEQTRSLRDSLQVIYKGKSALNIRARSGIPDGRNELQDRMGKNAGTQTSSQSGPAGIRHKKEIQYLDKH